MPNDFVCADCGHEQSHMMHCEKCSGIRVITIKIAEKVFGPSWRKAFDPEGIPENELPPGTKIKNDDHSVDT